MRYRYIQKLSAVGSETLPRCDWGEWEAEVGQVLGRLAFHTAMHHDAELEPDPLELLIHKRGILAHLFLE